jgi:hypothetical protein
MSEDYVVQAGDCISSIAFERGFFWETIWQHPQNAELRSRRKDPNILLAGDTVFVPDLELREHQAGTERRHRYMLRGAPAKLRLRVLEEVPAPPPPPAPGAAGAADSGGLGGLAASVGSAVAGAVDAVASAVSSLLPFKAPKDVVTEDAREPAKLVDQPRKGVPYVVLIDGIAERGVTDDDGRIELSIPPNAKSGTLILEPGTLREHTMALQLGHLDPPEDLAGLKQRLANLGFECRDRTSEPTEGFAEALRGFQAKYGLPETGEADGATRAKVRSLHGG